MYQTYVVSYYIFKVIRFPCTIYICTTRYALDDLPRFFSLFRGKSAGSGSMESYWRHEVFFKIFGSADFRRSQVLSMTQSK